MLYIVPTPVGNLEDMTFRAINVLKKVDVILAEDTRTSGKLLKHFDISGRVLSHHAHNERNSSLAIIEMLQNGQDVALISDAGTPGISDPGFFLVRSCHDANIPVSCLPGATAFVPALVSSGLPCDKFHFEGFLPHKKGRQTRMIYLSTLPITSVLYESPFRLLKALSQLAEHCGPERNACVAREISKVFEEVKTDTLENLHTYYSTEGTVKGEIVIILAGA